MGDGPIDLPDPLEQPHLDEESADELLAQMAGEEIDRLLREGDNERVPAVLVHPPPPSPPQPRWNPASHPPPHPPPPRHAIEPPRSGITVIDEPEPPRTIAELDEQAAQVADAVIQQHRGGDAPIAQGPAAAAATATTAHAIDLELARQLDEVFAQIKRPEIALPPTSATAAPASDSEETPSPPPEAAGPDDLLAQIGLLERQILNTEILQTTQKLLVEPIHPRTDPRIEAADEPAPRLPLYLRPLEWLSLPLAFCTDDARDTVGKVAIVTLVNALAILLYVLIFR